MLVQILNKRGAKMNLYNLLSKQITQQDLLNYYNATIIYDSLPKGINGFVMNYKNINVILINNNLSYYKKEKQYYTN